MRPDRLESDARPAWPNRRSSARRNLVTRQATRLWRSPVDIVVAEECSPFELVVTL